MILIETLHLLFIIYFGFSTIYLLGYALLAKIPYTPKPPQSNKKHKFAVLIPGYKEDAVIYHTAKNTTEQDYPKDLFDIIVIADSFKKETISKLKTLPIKLIEVSFDKSTKAKALNEAMNMLLKNYYDIALILDADNIIMSDFLQKINDSFNSGYQVVQGHRTAKNTDTAFAMLDAISEEINNNIFSKGHRVIGLSSRLVGSGMAFRYQLFQETMAGINAIGGFDKELELELLKKGYKFEYNDDAICLDEKVSHAEVYSRQRRRWIAAQFHYLKKYFFNALYHLLVNGKIDYFDKALQMMLPPRLLLPVVLFTFAAITYFLNYSPYYNAWAGLLVGNIFAFAISIPPKFYSLNLMRALIMIPKALWGTLIALFHLKKANRSFIHTPHNSSKKIDSD